MSTPPVTSSPFRVWLPRLGLAAWLLGAVLIWYLWQSFKREPGELVLYGSLWLLVLGFAAYDFVRGMFGPVFTYEITRLGRKTLTHFLRLLYILAISAILLLMYYSWLESMTFRSRGRIDSVPSNRLAEFASTFFSVYMVIQALVVAFLTPAYVAGCIADEKERKTLEFLLATDLRNHEIIFGKTAARVAFLLIFVLAGLPIIALMQLFGGIDPDLLLAGTAATLILVLGLASLSVAFSVAYKRPRNAIAVTFMLILFYAISSLSAAIFLKFYSMAPATYKTLTFFEIDIDCSPAVDWIARLSEYLAAGNPIYAVFELAVKPFGGNIFDPAEVGNALFRFTGFWAFVSTLSLGFAVTRLRRIALDQAYGGKGGGVANPVGLKKKSAKPPATSRGASTPNPATPTDEPVQATSGLPPIGNDPIFWREVFVEGSGRRGILGMIVSAIILILVFIFPLFIFLASFLDTIPVLNIATGFYPRNLPFEERWGNFNTAMIWWAKIATGVLTSLAMLAALIRGAGAISGEHDRDTWISLISAPLEAWEILRGKWLGAVLGLRRLYFVMILVWGLALATGSMQPLTLFTSFATSAVLISAYAWIGLLASITSRNTLIATVRAILAGLFFGGGFWIVLGICCILPINLVFDRRLVRELDIGEKLLFQLMSGTPPYMAGFMPIYRFEHSDELGPFDPEFNDSFGPVSFFVSFLFWLIFNGCLAAISHTLFAKKSNRLR